MDLGKSESPTSAVLQRACRPELASIREALGVDTVACLATTDGHCVCLVGATEQGGARVAAIGGSMLGLCEAFVREMQLGAPRYCAVVTDLGAIVIVRLPGMADSFALAVRAASSVNLGALLRAARDSAERLSSVIQSTLDQRRGTALPSPAPVV